MSKPHVLHRQRPRCKRGQVGIRLHSHERGVTVFVVMLAIVMLTGAGTWSMYSAGLTDQASGYARASAQAMYAAELGLLSGSSYLSIPGYADANFAVAMQSQAAGTPDSCWSVRDRTDGEHTFCKSMHMSDLDPTFSDETLTFSSTAYTLLDQAAAAGSMSPFAPGDAAAVQGNFILEMSEPRPVLIGGTETKSGMYQRVTLTSFGIVRPALDAAEMCTGSEANNAAATMMKMRAHMIIGPLSSQVAN